MNNHTEYRIKTYSIADLKLAFDDESLPIELLSTLRCYSYIHLPDVSEQRVVLVALEDTDNSLIGYMGIIPEKLQKPDRDVSWGITLYVNPKHRGKSYGYILNNEVMKYAEGTYMVINHVPATAKILTKKGHDERLYNKYYLILSRWNQYKGKFLNLKPIANILHKNIFKRNSYHSDLIHSLEYEYTYTIDQKTYEFIEKHSKNDVFLRTRAMFNWLLQYPFTIEAAVPQRTNLTYPFANVFQTNKLYAVKALINGDLIAVFILKMRNGVLSLLYRYYDENWKESFYASIIDHIQHLKPQSFLTTDNELKDYLIRNLNPYSILTEEFRFAFPKDNKDFDKKNAYIQGGDGDMFI